MATNTWRLVAIAAIVVVAFLIGFQPIGRPPNEVYSTFRVKFSKPILGPDKNQQQVVEEIKAALLAGGLSEDELDEIRVINDHEVEIATLALDQDQAERDKATVTSAVQKKYKSDVVEVGYPPGVENVRRPIWRLGNALAVFRPYPHINLGLDLQGGAHVVLRCLPYARMVFRAPENKPWVLPEGEEARAAVAKGWEPKETPETLTKRILRALSNLGVPPAEVKVELVDPTMLTVETHPANEKELKRQQKAILDVLRETYPQLKEEDIKVEEPEAIFLESGVADKVKNIIDRRLYAMSEIREPIIQKQGQDRIIVELPGVRDPERVLRILKSTAMLKFVLVPAKYEPVNPEADEYDEWKDKTTGETVRWERVLAESQVKFTGKDLKSNADVGPGQRNDWVVHFELIPKRKRDFYNFTRANVGRIMAIVLDDKCQMAPTIRDAIPGRGIIEGNFTTQEARDLKLLLNAGALPVPLEIAENRTVSPTLGRDSVVHSLQAGLLGFAAVVLYMLIFYRKPGLIADVALIIYVMIVFAVLVMANTTLTLPGIAGIVLSIGMAVDANVLIFERLKEELWAGKGARTAIDAGFNRAWTAILDSNVTTLIGAAVLYFLGTSSIKTFAVTLSVGVLCSMFTAITVTRWLLEIFGSSRVVASLVPPQQQAGGAAGAEASAGH
ncbi:MAG: protein translocase subunit SecD [Armatimonadetes bacterium]|nr:protein translocase subunit SecD [Armatimonadota bacterium]